MRRPIKPKRTPHEVREAAHADFSDRTPKAVMQRRQQILDGLKYRGLNFKLHNDKNLHVIVKGPAREVHFYGTTGTVHARPDGGRQEYWLRGASLEAALDRVTGLSNTGH